MSDPLEEWEQLQLRMKWPEQRSYETIRPVVLFAESAAARAVATGEPVRTIYRHLHRFQMDGFAGLTAAAHPKPSRTLPPAVRQLILDLKGEHAPLRPNELARICFRRLAYRPGARTINRVLAETPPTPPAQRRFPRFHAMSAVGRRRAIIQLHVEGWGKQSIAVYMQTTRKTVHAIVRRFSTEDLAALYPQSRRPRRHVRKVTLATMQRVRELQKNPALGAFRLHTKLKQEGIHISPRTAGRIKAQHLAETRPPVKDRPVQTPLEMPFKAVRRHQYWSIDIRYLDMHQLGGGNIYCISILENYSRAVLNSVVTRSQDLTTYLHLLFLTIRNHGAPEAIVTDGGAVFRAKRASAIYQALEIHKDQIDPGEPWQNYIETAFNVQRRMADYHFAQVTTWEALLEAHATWLADYNYQDHWAHRERTDNRTSPFQVLAWVRGRPYQDADLHYLFYSTRFQRHVGRHGYLRFRNWRVYAEEGLTGDNAVVWLYQEHLTIAFKDVLLGHYHVTYQPDEQHFATVGNPHFYPTSYRSPQLTFWDRHDPLWRNAYRVPLYPVKKRSRIVALPEQLPLPLNAVGE